MEEIASLGSQAFVRSNAITMGLGLDVRRRTVQSESVECDAAVALRNRIHSIDVGCRLDGTEI